MKIINMEDGNLLNTSKVFLFTENENNNLVSLLQQLHTLNLNNRPQPCDTNDVSWINEGKKKLAKAANKKVNLDITFHEEVSSVQLEKKLLDVQKDAQESLYLSRVYLEEKRKELECLQKYSSSLKEIKQNLEKKLERNLKLKNQEKNHEKSTKIYSTTSSIFKNTRKDLKNVLEQLHIDEDLTKMLSELTTKHFHGGDDEYIDIADCNFKHLHLLFNANIVEKNPRDNKKFKIKNLR